MKKTLLTIATFLGFFTAQAQSIQDFSLELSTTQAVNQRGSLNEVKINNKSGFYASASLVAFGHYLPDFAGTKADDYGLAVLGCTFAPFTSGPLQPVQLDLGAGFAVDGYGENWYSPSFRSMSPSVQAELRYPVALTERITFAGEVGNLFSVAGANETKFDLKNTFYIGVSSIWSLTK